MLSIFFFFFFSSRRRHTRSLRDWSSDVCSSDLFPRTSFRGAAEGREPGIQTQVLLNVPRSLFRAHACHQDGRYRGDRKSTRLNSSHVEISYAVFCLKKKINKYISLLRILKYCHF